MGERVVEHVRQHQVPHLTPGAGALLLAFAWFADEQMWIVPERLVRAITDGRIRVTAEVGWLAGRLARVARVATAGGTVLAEIDMGGRTSYAARRQACEQIWRGLPS